MTPGDSVRVTIGGRMHDAEVLYTRGVSVRVRLADGREKTVPVDRVRAEKRRVIDAVADEGYSIGVDYASGPDMTVTTEVAIPPSPRAFRESNPHMSDAALAASYAVAALKAVPKPKPPWRSSEYRAFVRTFPCAMTGRPAEEAHHHGPHAMSRKGPDWFCIPLAANVHERFHREGTFFGMSRAQTDALAIDAQIKCMTAWCEAHGLDYMTAVRDALARVVEGEP